MASKLSPHFPIITPRVEFSLLSQSQPPAIITSHIDFAEVWTKEDIIIGPSHAVNRESPFPSHYSDDDDSVLMDIDELESDRDASDDDAPLSNLDNVKIPKPPGEPGQPNSGGYNIEHELRVWGAEKISQVTKFVKGQADDLLDTTQSYSKQNSAHISLVCNMTAARFPVIKKYSNCWPVCNMLKLHLKYTSELHRKQEQPRAKGKVTGKAQGRGRSGSK